MKKYLSLLLFLLVPAFMFAQENDYEKREKEYKERQNKFHAFMEENKSSEEDEYFKNRTFKEYKPLNKEVFSNYYDDFFMFVEVDDFTPYNDTLYFTPYQDSVDQLGMEYWWSDSLHQYVGEIDRFQIIKQEKKRR